MLQCWCSHGFSGREVENAPLPSGVLKSMCSQLLLASVPTPMGCLTSAVPADLCLRLSLTHLQRLYMLFNGLDNFLAMAMTNAVSGDLFKWFAFCSLWREFCFSAKLW